MAAFQMKEWLDRNVVPLLSDDLKIYSFVWNGDPPKQILVWLVASSCALARTGDDERAASPEFSPTQWPRATHRLIVEHDFRFDYTREQQMVRLESGLIPIFGCDGAPLFGKEGTAAVRLFRRMNDGVDLILQVGCTYPPVGDGSKKLSPGQHAAAAVKGFFGLFDVPALQVCQKFSAPFGQA